MRKVIFFSVFILLFSISHAQVIKVAVDTNAILIGEPIHLQVKGTFPLPNSSLPVIDTIPHFEIMEKSKVDSLLMHDSVQLTQTYTITSWDSGKWTLPQFFPNNTSITIAVGYTPFDVNQPYNDIKDIVDVKKPEKSNWIWYVIGALLVLVLFLLFFPPGKKPAEAPKYDKNAYRKAMDELNTLKSEQVAEKDVKEYYTRLTSIFRTYMANRWGIESYSKTTGDLAIQLQEIKMHPDDYKLLVQVLRLSDLVKFAKFHPLAADNDKSFNIISGSITTIEQAHVV
jgi:hypothetical protein